MLVCFYNNGKYNTCRICKDFATNNINVAIALNGVVETFVLNFIKDFEEVLLNRYKNIILNRCKIR